jgi:hypothetical protein
MQEATHQALSRAYQAILTDEALASLEQVETDLAGVFLPSAPANPVSLMIVGRETTSWFGGFRKIHSAPRAEYIAASMERHHQAIGQRAGRSKFRQFYKKAEKIIEPTGGSVAWHNLFAISFKKNSPVRCKAISHIADLSRKLLLAQIEILQPRAVLFVSGPSYDSYIKACFQGRMTGSHVYEKRRLWGFKIDGTPCFRTNHPRCAKGESARTKSLQLLLGTNNNS